MSATDPSLRLDWRHRPAPQRLAPDHPRRAAILSRHDAAMASGLPCYTDPTSGFSVFTAAFLESRTYCCDSGCRHCPYVE